MHDLRLIRDNRDLFDRALARRGLAPQAGAILKIDEERRHHQAQLQEMQQRRNAASKEIGVKKSRGEDAAGLMQEVAQIKTTMDTAQQQEGELAEKLNGVLAQLPNLPADDVPDGQDETANQEIRRWGEPKRIDNPKPHDVLGEALGQMDFAQAAKMSGARFVVLRDGLARLERALANFMLDLHTGEYGYQEVNPPHLVRDDAVFGTGQLPKFAEDLFKTTDGYWLIPTAEVSLTNLVADSILDAQVLPLRFTAFTPCYRSEAGAAGKDTRGMIRQHQFSKVELVSIVRPEESDTELERMVGCAEEVLRRLELPYRVMKLCAGDMGFSARRTYDLEVWLPAQNQYREISSCSSCGDFQARRMGARFKEAGQKGTNFVHTLNGSGLAVGRTLVAILENYQEPDGSVTIPTVLRPYMKGQEVLRPS